MGMQIRDYTPLNSDLCNNLASVLTIITGRRCLFTRAAPYMRKLHIVSENSNEALPGVLGDSGIWGEGPFIFRDLGSF